MAIESYTLVTYNGIDIGSIYLNDLSKRTQLGGAIQWEFGQDIVISSGRSICFVTTGDVLASKREGTLHRYGTDNEPTLLQLLIDSGQLSAGSTGFTAPLSISESDVCVGDTVYGGGVYGGGDYGE